MGVDEAAIDLLGRAARTATFDESILTKTPAKDVADLIGRAISKLRAVNLDRLLRRQGPLSRITGADLEERLRFEVAVEEVAKEMRLIAKKRAEVRRIRDALVETRGRIATEQIRLDRVIGSAKRILASAQSPDPFLRDRFERRLANLVALRVSNTMTIEQMRLAEQNLAGLLDRLHEVEHVLFPLWQRDSMAIAQSPVRIRRRSELAEAYFRRRNALLETLFAERTP